MGTISTEKRDQVIGLFREHKLSTEEIAARQALPLTSIRAIQANLTRGAYDKKPMLILLALSVLALFPACSTMPSSGISIDPSSGRGELTEQFIRGDARLECQLSCA